MSLASHDWSSVLHVFLGMETRPRERTERVLSYNARVRKQTRASLSLGG